jgi:hypothetical protein
MKRIEKLRPEAIAASAARGLTRRRLLRNAGGAALGAAVATAYVERASEAVAQCSYSDVCGPAPLCGGARCDSWRCLAGRADTDWAVYQSGPAPCSGTSGVNNCWETGCFNGQIWRCCDCCARDAGCTAGDTCFSCGAGSWHKCICRGPVGTC